MLFATITFAVTAALPHDPGLSSVRLTRAPDAIVVQAAFANADFTAATRVDRDHDGVIAAGELAAAEASLSKWVADRFAVVATDGALAFEGMAAALAENDDVELTLHFAPCAGAVTLTVPFLSELSHGHRSYASVQTRDGRIVVDALLHRAATTITAPPDSALAGGHGRGFGQGLAFFGLGIEHILIGFDHLAFLLVLLAAGITWRRVLATITAFTVAHSLTLIVATLDVVRLPSLLVESSIAGSIVVVALLNFLQRGSSAPHRWPLAFGFGLIHGFGFAGVLAELFDGSRDVIVPLLTFNLGVEVGQLAFAAVVIPLLAIAVRAGRARALSVSLSAVVGSAGVYWLLERLL